MHSRAALLVIVGLPSAALAQATFEAIPPFIEGQHTFLTRVSGDGQVIAGSGAYPYRVLRWRASSGYESVMDPDGYFPRPAAISYDGSIIAGNRASGLHRLSFRWASTFTADIGVPSMAEVNGMSRDGSLIIGHWSIDHPLAYNVEPFIATESGVWFPFRPSPTTFSGVDFYCISGDGKLVYGNWFRWNPVSQASSTLLGSFGGMLAANDDGSVLVGYTWPPNTRRPIRWTHFGDAGSFPLHPSYLGEAQRISGDGQRILGIYTPAWGTPFRTFIWEANSGLRDLRQYLISRGANIPPGWEIAGSDISADGTVLVGVFRTALNQPWQGWRATIPPPCYANCDSSTHAPTLNIFDLQCFLQRYLQGDLYANCDGSSQAPYLTVADFSCFLSKFVAGCP